MRYFNSRLFPKAAQIRTVTVKKRADGWYISVLLNLAEELPVVIPVEQVKGINALDVGINKLTASSDGSFGKNPRFATNAKTRRLMRIRHRRVSRKHQGSENRAKAAARVAKLHKQVADKREAYQWKLANREVEKADAIAHEQLNIPAMKKRCRPVKSATGRFLPNGQSAKRGLNRAISDAAWGQLFQMIGWLAAKAGKPVFRYNPRHTSQECSQCHHVSASNRDGERFLCAQCGHIDRSCLKQVWNKQQYHSKSKHDRLALPSVPL
jgi:putative transposase